jgi:hypothetical protein
MIGTRLGSKSRLLHRDSNRIPSKCKCDLLHTLICELGDSLLKLKIANWIAGDRFLKMSLAVFSFSTRCESPNHLRMIKIKWLDESAMNLRTVPHSYTGGSISKFSSETNCSKVCVVSLSSSKKF